MSHYTLTPTIPCVLSGAATCLVSPAAFHNIAFHFSSCSCILNNLSTLPFSFANLSPSSPCKRRCSSWYSGYNFRNRFARSWYSWLIFLSDSTRLGEESVLRLGAICRGLLGSLSGTLVRLSDDLGRSSSRGRFLALRGGEGGTGDFFR